MKRKASPKRKPAPMVVWKDQAALDAAAKRGEEKAREEARIAGPSMTGEEFLALVRLVEKATRMP